MDGRLMLIAQKIIPMVLKAQPILHENIAEEDCLRIRHLLEGLPTAEVNEITAWCWPILRRRRLMNDPSIQHLPLESRTRIVDVVARVYQLKRQRKQPVSAQDTDK